MDAKPSFGYNIKLSRYDKLQPGMLFEFIQNILRVKQILHTDAIHIKLLTECGRELVFDVFRQTKVYEPIEKDYKQEMEDLRIKWSGGK